MESASLNPLYRADGSATYTSNGYAILAAVNGPMEVQRRDELPEEAAIDVAIRPASGVGGVRERHLESIIQNTLRHVILVSAHPRTLIQITLQIITRPGDDSSNLIQGSSNLHVLPALLQASILALLSASIPMSMTLTAALIAAKPNNELICNPALDDLKTASSIHVLAFSSHGDLLVVQSEGDFSIETWEEIYEKASQICQKQEDQDDSSEDVEMNSDDNVTLKDVLRDVVQENVTKERKWKESLS